MFMKCVPLAYVTCVSHVMCVTCYVSSHKCCVMSFVMCDTRVTCHVCHMLCVTSHMCCVMSFVMCVTCHLSHLTCYIVLCHLSHVMCNVSHLTSMFLPCVPLAYACLFQLCVVQVCVVCMQGNAWIQKAHLICKVSWCVLLWRVCASVVQMFHVDARIHFPHVIYRLVCVPVRCVCVCFTHVSVFINV